MLGLVLYPLLAATSLVLSAYAWEKLPATSARPNSVQRNAIFFGCVVGLAVGAKLGFFLAEGPWFLTHPGLTSNQRLLQLMAGKTITGALIGAYAGVEYAKHRVSYREPTGDTFALIAPCSIALSRLGCLAQGCCLGTPMSPNFLAVTDREGISRWPAVPFELAFNLAFLLFVIVIQQLRKHAAPGCLRGQLFHVYLLSYGLFRFGHEFLRDTPRWHGAWSGYHALALSLTLLGAWGFARRMRLQQLSAVPPSCAARAVPTVDRANEHLQFHYSEFLQATLSRTAESIAAFEAGLPSDTPVRPPCAQYTRRKLLTCARLPSARTQHASSKRCESESPG